MVDRDEERGIRSRKQRRDELELRIGNTNAGYDWLRRINQIGKRDFLDDIRKESEDGEDETSSQ